MLSVLEILRRVRRMVEADPPKLCAHRPNVGDQHDMTEWAMWYQTGPFTEVHYWNYPNYQEGGREILRIRHNEWPQKDTPIDTVIDRDPYYETSGEATVRLYRGIPFTTPRIEGPNAEELQALDELFEYVRKMVPSLPATQQDWP